MPESKLIGIHNFTITSRSNSQSEVALVKISDAEPKDPMLSKVIPRKKPRLKTFRKEISKPKEEASMKTGTDGIMRMKTIFANWKTTVTKDSEVEDNDSLTLTNTIAPPQDNTEGYAITTEMRNTQLKLNRMRKYRMLANKKQETREEGQILRQKLKGKIALEQLQDIATKLDEMRNAFNNERTQRWKIWVET